MNVKDRIEELRSALEEERQALNTLKDVLPTDDPTVAGLFLVCQTYWAIARDHAVKLAGELEE